MEEKVFQGYTYRRSAPGEAWQRVGPAGGTSAPSSGMPSFVPGVKTVDPVEAERDRIGLERDKVALNTAQVGLAAKQKEALTAEEIKTRESQDKASAFLTRAFGANNTYERQGVGPRGTVGQFVRDTFPNAQNEYLPEILGGNSPERQVADSSQDEFIAASLRQDSGAAIPPEEMQRQRQIYFPMPGDGPEAIAQKKAARLRAISGLIESAGPAIGAEQRKMLDGIAPQLTEAQKGNYLAFLDEDKPATGYRLTPEQNAQIEQAIKSGDEGLALSLEKQFTGYDPSPETIEAIRTNIRDAKNNPNYRFVPNYGDVDAAAQTVSDRERFGDYLDPALKARSDGSLGTSVDAAVRGAADVIPFSDEIAAAGNTLLSGGTYADNVRKERAIDEADSRVNFGARLTGQIGGAALPVGRFAGFGRVPGAARSALSYGAEGGVLGGLYAAGKADPNPDASLGDSLALRASAAPTGVALGAGLGYSLGALGNRFRNSNGPNGGGPGAQRAAEVARAGRDENVVLSRPVVDENSRNAMSYLESSIGGSGVVRRSLDETARGIETRAGELGAGGTVLDETAAGSVVQEAGRRYINRSRGIASRLYDRAAQMAGGATVRPQEAVRVLDEQIADLGRNANQNAPLINYLQEVRGDLADDTGALRDKLVGDIRDIRTQLRGNISNRGLTATDAERRVGLVLDAARNDIQRDLNSVAPAAVRQYDRADRFYREKQAEIKNVVQKVLGNSRNPADQISPEKAWQSIKTMAGPRGDSRGLSRMWQKLEPNEQADAAASIAATFGRRSADEEFSPARFINSVRGLSNDARQTVFGPEGARSLRNLRTLSEAYRDTAARLNNSRSGQVVQWGNFLKSFVPFAGGGALVGGVPGAIAGGAVATSGALARNLSARALMSPNMTRWLAGAPRQTTPQAIRRYITDGLSTVARRDPAIAQDALGLQRQLLQAFDATPSRAAAEDEKQ